MPAVHRKVCPCGGGCPHCAAEAAQDSTGFNEEETLHRKALDSSRPARVPSVVHQVLRSPGHLLDTATRAAFEARFGHDFGNVRLHTDGAAMTSARAVNALAYTSGNHIVFGQGQYEPSGFAGQELLAHELAHVVQQRGLSGMPETVSSACDPLEQAADRAASYVMGPATPRSGSVSGQTTAGPVLSRRVAGVHCAANQFGAPADPRTELETADRIAIPLCVQMANDLQTDSNTVLRGIPDTPSVTLQAYEDHFGLPIPEGAGFLNRLTGIVRPTQELALSEELATVARRFALVARFMREGPSYICPGARPLGPPPCTATPCGPRDDAFSCPGNSLIALCQPFWTNYNDTARAQILIHESMHVTLGNIGIGSILDATTRGAGRNFNIAGCYESLLADRTGADSHVDCPAVPG